MQSKILIVCAPSGGGKGTIIKLLREHYGDRMWVSVSCTSRPPRGREQEGVDYYFISQEEFDRLLERDYLAEYNRFGNGKCYGTPADKLEQHLAEGCVAVLDIDINGARQVIDRYYDKYPIAAVFIAPESLRELRLRLVSRGTETPDQIDQRIDTARREYRQMRGDYGPLFDAVLLNAKGRQAETAAEVARIADSINEPRGTAASPFRGDFQQRYELFAEEDQ